MPRTVSEYEQKNAPKFHDDDKAQRQRVATDVTDPLHGQMMALQYAPDGARDNLEPENTLDPRTEQKTAVVMDPEREKGSDIRPVGPQKDTAEAEPRLQLGKNSNIGGETTAIGGLPRTDRAPQGADQGKPVRTQMPTPTSDEHPGGVPNSERPHRKKKISPSELRQLQYERSLAHHPHLYEEIQRRMKGMTPLENLDHLEEVDFDQNDLAKELKHKEEHADASKWNTNFIEAREKRRQEEREWRDANRRGLTNMHDIQQWQRRGPEDHDRFRQSDERGNDDKGHGILGSISTFASDKWHSLTHSNKDKSDESRNESGGRARAALGERTNVRQESLVQKPGTPIRKEPSSPVRHEEPAKRSWWPSSWGQNSELQHMPSWKENTRLVDSMTDDELSMLAL